MNKSESFELNITSEYEPRNNKFIFFQNIWYKEIRKVITFGTLKEAEIKEINYTFDQVELNDSDIAKIFADDKDWLNIQESTPYVPIDDSEENKKKWHNIALPFVRKIFNNMNHEEIHNNLKINYDSREKLLKELDRCSQEIYMAYQFIIHRMPSESEQKQNVIKSFAEMSKIFKTIEPEIRSLKGKMKN